MGMVATTTNLTYARNDYIKQGRSHIFDRCADMIYYFVKNNDVATTHTNTVTHTISSALTTGTIRSVAIGQTMTAAATANIVEALNVTLTSNVKTGAWANAIVGSINYSTAGAAHGMAAGICAEMIPPNGSLARGALYSLDCAIGPGASSTWGSAGPVAFIKMENWGTQGHFDDNGFLFHLVGPTADSGHLYDTDASAATGDATLKIRIGTATKYLLVADDAG